MKIKLYSVIENVSKHNKKYWKIKLAVEDNSKISFIVDINKKNYEVLTNLYEKEVNVEDSLMPSITAQGVYQGSAFVTRTLKGKGINEFMQSVYGLTFENEDMLKTFLSTGFIEPEKIVEVSTPEDANKKGMWN